MGNKGRIVIGYAGDPRDLDRTNKHVIKGVKDTGRQAGKAALASGKMAGKRFGDGFSSEVEDAGKKGGEGFSSSLKTAAVAGVAAVAVAVGASVGQAMEKQKLGSKVAASLDLTKGQARKAGKVASGVYADAWGENMPAVSDAVESVMSSIDGMANQSPKKLRAVTEAVLNIEDALDVDASSAARDFGILIKNGLAKDATQAADLMVAGLQKVPKAMRGDFSDAVEEYSQFFADLGFSGPQSIGLLVRATEDGKYGIDKMGDAIKEFSVRSVDGSKLTGSAFKAIGLDSDDMANKFLKGGDTAKDAFRKTVEGLLGIKDPAKRAQAAVSLFGTPLEDLGVKGIPKFLESLLGAEGGLGKTEGKAKKFGTTLNDSVATKFEGAKRKAQQFLSDGLLALYDGFDTGKAKGEGFAGALSEAGASLKPVYEFVKGITEIPGFDKFAGKLLAIGGAVAGMAVVYKFSGLSFLANTLIPDLGDNAKTAAIKLGPLVAAVAILAELTAEANKLNPEESGWETFIKSPIRGFNAGLKNTRDLIGSIGDWIRGMDWDWLPTDKEMASAFSDFGNGIKNGFRDAYNGAASSEYNPVKLAGKIKTGVTKKARETTDAVGGWFSKMSKRAGGSFTNLKDRGIKRFREFKGEATNKARETADNVGGWFSRMKTRTGRKLTEMKTGALDRFGDMKRGATRRVRDMADSVGGWVGRMKTRTSSKLGDLRNSSSRIWKQIRNGAVDRARDLRDKVVDVFNDMRTKAGRSFSRFWNGLKMAAAKPVNFLIKWVWNRGLRAVLNKIPGVDLKEVKPIKLARGGPVNGPGTGTSDSVPAKLSRGEHVWTAKEVEAVGGQSVMYGMRKAALRHELEFAKGGAVSSDRIAKAQAFARQQSGKPYGWGAVGPSAYDCSGFMSAITNVLRGRPPHMRVGSTASFPWGGFVKGPGQFTIGSSKNFSGGIGHMAGNLAGMGVESRGGRGVIIGGGAMSPGRFAGQWHLGSSGGDFGSGGNWWDDLKSVVSTLGKLPGRIRKMMSMDSWVTPFLKKAATFAAEKAVDHLNKKIPDIGPIKTNPIKVPKFDRGGVLSPGLNTVYNGLGRPEPLVRADAAPMVLEIRSSGSEVDDMLVKILRHAVKIRGAGNVQAALGVRGRG